MGKVKSLAGFKQAEENRNQYTDIDWLRIDPDEAVLVQFLQEVDEGAENFDADDGVGFINVEHVAPGKDGWKRRATCTIDDEGRCFPCEEGWKQKSRFYANVWYKERSGDEGVAVLNQGWGPQTVVDTVYEAAAEDGTIKNKWFKLSRKGKGLNTKYTLWPKKLEDFEDYVALNDLEDEVELFDLEDEVITYIPYEKQEEFYLKASTPDEESDDSDTDEEDADAAW